LVAAEGDTLCLAKYAEEAAARIGTAELFVLPGAGHFDVYRGEALEEVLRKEVSSFLRTHLLAEDAA